VGADVFHLSWCDFRPNPALVRGSTCGISGNPTILMEQNIEQSHEGWDLLPAEHLPRPNYFPAGLAMGTTFLFWGFVTSWVILAVGTGLFIASLAGWITEIRRERNLT
jgi:hypothetical protein